MRRSIRRLERHAVARAIACVNAHRRRRALLDGHAEREPKLLRELGRERLGHRQDQLASAWTSSGTTVRCDRHLRGHERPHLLGGARKLTGRRGGEAHRLGEEAREHHLVDPRDLEQVRDQVAPVDHLACEGLFDLSHARDLTLDDE